MIFFFLIYYTSEVLNWDLIFVFAPLPLTPSRNIWECLETFLLVTPLVYF
jgi:hypothetical protein